MKKPIKFGIMLCITCGHYKIKPDKVWIMMYGKDSYCICSGQPNLVQDTPSRLYLLDLGDIFEDKSKV